MRTKRKRRKKKAVGRSEQKIIDLILRAAFTEEEIFLQAPIMMASDDYKKYPVHLIGFGSVIVKFYVPAMHLNRMNIVYGYDLKAITPREALEFFYEHKAHAVYPKID
jgi:hypothetical protein